MVVVESGTPPLPPLLLLPVASSKVALTVKKAIRLALLRS